ncbi:MAG: NAD(P)/FAD-dependent oxidoreductase [Christensenellales bacterium]|jgi:predicted Rossmann fold flavoprotein
MTYDVIVIGGGPAGMLAAGRAGELHKKTLLLEKNEKLGKKLYLTGKGRCNITNACDRESFFSHIISNPRFLYSAYSRLDNEALLALLADYGLKTKVERGNRVFPVSDKASDVSKALTRYMEQGGVEVRLRAHVRSIAEHEAGFSVGCAHDEVYVSKSVIICTGGLSYPSTGSTGDGYAFAGSFGHGIKPTSGALVPLETVEEWPHLLSGLTLKNIVLRAFVQDERVFEEQGEVLFTHFGLSGPLVLSLSSRVRGCDCTQLKLCIDLKPALSPEQLDKRILREFENDGNKEVQSVVKRLTPAALAQQLLRLCEIPPEQKIHQITRVQRSVLAGLFKKLPLAVKAFRPVEEAVVTRGGVDVREVNPSTMESKHQKGLYFAGEVLDIDGLTGGFNLQIAFSTGYAAGENA